MAYPIFDETMVDLSWPEVEAAGKENRPVILPVGVIEEHGPHLDLAADVYLAHKRAKDCRRELRKREMETLIAPPFYWGINTCTGRFPGSFSVREETMIMLLADIAGSLQSWGFRNIYIINLHGDYAHIMTILKAVREIRRSTEINIRYIFDGDKLEVYRIPVDDEAVLPFFCDGSQIPPFSYSEFADIHAGGAETGCMLKDYPNSVNKDILAGLKDSRVPWDQLRAWRGENAREMTPLGYCGNPTNVNIENIRLWDEAIAGALADSILKDLRA